ncbi:hypothetical protein bcere0021_53120 [Bacillus cereus Rock3-42]|nr:hypothetical protein bcere0021_53120 [Bacillus cereus Rock3-42]
MVGLVGYPRGIWGGWGIWGTGGYGGGWGIRLLGVRGGWG